MGFDKLAADLCGESVLTRSMLALAACGEVAEIRVVTSPEKFEPVGEAATRLAISKFVEVIPGGAERHLSVSAGLARIDDDRALVAVHDAARPLVSRAAITGAIARARAGDIVLVAGKGHEDYQEVAGVKHPFDDTVVAREALRMAAAAGDAR